MNSPEQSPQEGSQEQPEPSQQEKLAAALAEQEKWEAVLAVPSLSSAAHQLAVEALRSVRAEVRLRRKGLAFLSDQTDDAALAQTLGLSNSPPDPATTSEPPNPEP